MNTSGADPTIDPTGDAAKEIAEAAQTDLISSVESLAAGTTDTTFTAATDTTTLLKDSTAAVAAIDRWRRHIRLAGH